MANIFLRPSGGGSSASGGTSDHGALSGLLDNDHPQYSLTSDTATLLASLNAHTGDTSVHFTVASIDHGSISGLLDDDHPQYIFSGGDQFTTLTGDTLTASTVAIEHIQFDVNHTPDVPIEGELHWNSDIGGLEIGMPGGQVFLQIGQELLARVRNTTGALIPNGSVVLFTGASGNLPLISGASASDATIVNLAMVTEDIDHNSNGYVTRIGLVNSLNTSAFTSGDEVWLASGASGQITTSPPGAPYQQVKLGIVIRSHATEGSIYFNPNPALRLEDLSNIDGASADATNRYLVWDVDAEYWNPSPIYFSGITDTGHTHSQYALTSDTALTNAQFTGHTADTSIHFTVASIDHGSIAGLFDNDHPQYALTGDFEVHVGYFESHTADTSIHYTVDSIDHGSISGLLDDDHPQYALSANLETVSGDLNTHTADTSIHFTEASIDHGSIAGLGDDDHPQYRLTAATISLSGDLAQEGAVLGQVATWDGSQWIPSGTPSTSVTVVPTNVLPYWTATGDTMYTGAGPVDLSTLTIPGGYMSSVGDALVFKTAVRSQRQAVWRAYLNDVQLTFDSLGPDWIQTTQFSVAELSFVLQYVDASSAYLFVMWDEEGTTTEDRGGAGVIITGFSFATDQDFRIEFSGDAGFNHECYYVTAELVNGSSSTIVEYDSFSANSLSADTLYVNGQQFNASGSPITDHGSLTGLFDNDHPQYTLTGDFQSHVSYFESHTGDSTVHFTVASIDHGSIAGLLDNDHPQYTLTGDFQSHVGYFESHTADTSIHFTVASIDHGSIAGLFDNDHPQYRLTGVTISLSGDLAQEGAALGEVLTWDGSQWIPSGFTAGGGVSDHGSLTGLFDNDHPQYRLTADTISLSGDLAQEGAAIGDVPRWDGTKWVASAVTEGGGGGGGSSYPGRLAFEGYGGYNGLAAGNVNDYTVTIPANTIQGAGDMIFIEAMGRCANTSPDMVVAPVVGGVTGTQYEYQITSTSGGDWHLKFVGQHVQGNNLYAGANYQDEFNTNVIEGGFYFEPSGTGTLDFTSPLDAGIRVNDQGGGGWILWMRVQVLTGATFGGLS